METWVVIALAVAALLIVAGLTGWYVYQNYQKGKAPPKPEEYEPFEPGQPFGPLTLVVDVDYFHSGSFFTLGYWTDHYFTIAGAGVPPVAPAPTRGNIRNHYYYTGGG